MRRAVTTVAGLLLIAVMPIRADEIRIGGGVNKAGGAPLADAEVRLVPLLDRLDEARAALHGSTPEETAALALTDEGGRFQLVAPHAGLWSVRVAAPGFVPVETLLQPLIDTVELPPVQLVEDAGLTVRTVDPDGRPVAGALVVLRAPRARFLFDDRGWRPILRSARSGEDGTARLARGARERPTLSASAAGFVPKALRGHAGNSATLRLEHGVSRSIEVVSADGRPAAGVLVALGERSHPVGETDAAGRLTARIDAGRPTPLTLVAGDGRRLESRLQPRVAGEASNRPRRFELPPRLLVAGRLLDAQSRRPIGGAIVWDGTQPAESAVTDRSGGFVLGGPARARLEIRVGAPGYVAGPGLPFQLLDDGRPGPTLALHPAATLEGTITDSDGTPVEGAEAQLEVKRNPGMMRIEIGGGTARPRGLSDAKGKFRLGQIDPEQNYTLKVGADGFAEAEKTVEGLEPYVTRSGVQVRLSRGQGLYGRVVDGEGQPLRDAEVRAEAAASGHGMRMMRFAEGGGDEPVRTSTDDTGRFDLSGLAAATYDLEITRSGFASRDLSAVELQDDGDPVDVGEVVLERGERVQGFVLDRDGQPVEGARIEVGEAGPMLVMLAGPGVAAEEETDATSDATGWFAVDDLARGKRYNLSASRSGFVDGGAQAIEIPRLDPVEIRLQPASRVSGTVLDPDGEPILGAQVNLRRSRTMEMGGNVMQVMMMIDATTDHEGRFVFEDQEPGTISLSVSASGFQEAKRDNIEIPKGEDLEDLELALAAGAIVQGRVTAPDGRAAIGASVRLVGGESGGMMAALDRGAPSDGNGIYRLEGLRPGSVSIEATHPDYPRAVRDLDVREGVNSLDLAFEGGHAVSGTITDESGNPVGAAAVRLVPVGRFWGGPEGATEGDGRFRVDGVQDGEYRVWVDAEGYASSAGKVPLRVEGQPVAGVAVTLGRGATVVGTVSGLDPERFSGVGVRAQGGGIDGLGGARVDYEGNYRLEHLQAGSYDVVASLDGTGRQAQGRAVIEEGTTELRVDLEFGRGLTLSGRALQAEQPIVGASVFVEGVDVTRTGWSQTGYDGDFSVEGLETGSYDVHLRNWQTGLAYNERVELGTSREVLLEVPTARVGGRIIDSADRQPLAGVNVTLISDAQGETVRLPTHTATTDMDGRFELANVGDGAWRLKTGKQGYAAADRPLTVQFGKPVEELRLELEATEGLTLEAALPGGSSPDELRVAVLDDAGNAVVSGTYATGERGRVRLSSVPPGAWEVIVSAAGAATSSLRAQAPGPSVPVALQPATSLRLRVPELDGSDVLATVSLVDADQRPFRSLGWDGRPRSEWRMAGGALEFAALPPGSWRVEISSADGRKWTDSAVTSPGSAAELVLE